MTFDAFLTTTDYSENDGSPLTGLAKQSGAIGGRALYQMLNMTLRDDDERIWALPVPFLFFGFYTKIREPAVAARYYLDSGTELILSEDVERDLMHRIHVPVWPHRSDGNAYVNNLDNIKMPQVEWTKWIFGCAETVVHFGKTENLCDRELEDRRELAQLRKRCRIRSEGTDEEGSNGSTGAHSPLLTDNFTTRPQRCRHFVMG